MMWLHTRIILMNLVTICQVSSEMAFVGWPNAVRVYRGEAARFVWTFNESVSAKVKAVFFTQDTLPMETPVTVYRPGSIIWGDKYGPDKAMPRVKMGKNTVNMTIFRVQPSEARVPYRCMLIYYGLYGTMNSQAWLVVYDVPTTPSVKLSLRHIRENDVLNMTCSASSTTVYAGSLPAKFRPKKAITYTWLRDNRLITDDGRHQIGGGSRKTISINPVKREDDSISYTCVAKDVESGLTNSHAVRLRINVSPRWSMLYPPGRVQEADIGNDTFFIVWIKSRPLPKPSQWQWSFLPSDSPENATSNPEGVDIDVYGDMAILTLINVTNSHYGNYQIWTSNDLGGWNEYELQFVLRKPIPFVYQSTEKQLMFVGVVGAISIIVLLVLWNICHFIQEIVKEKEINARKEHDIQLLESTITFLKPEDILIETLLSQGTFYDIWQGKIKDDMEENRMATFKKVKGSSDIYTKYLQTQGFTMSKLNYNDPIIDCLGMTADYKLLVMETAPLGNLKQYLEARRYDESIETLRTKFIPQIIQGLQVVHDLKPSALFYCLSASDVLLCSENKCKLTGFASKEMVRAREKWEEYNKIPRPYHWLSPEAIHLNHMKQSDIWSFGILIWEIFSPGQLPMGNISSKDARKDILNGITPLKPETCPDRLFDLLVKCWFHYPQNRPSIYELKFTLQEIMGYKMDTDLEMFPWEGTQDKESGSSLDMDVHTYEETDIITDSLLCSGDFYEVWKGTVSESEDPALEVVIKKIKENNDVYVEYLHSQGICLWTLRDHGHVIECLGITSDNSLLVMEPASLGDLQQYLKDKGNDSSLQYLAMDFIPQIIEGVEAVHNLRPPALFHCLCASNVLLSDGEQCKLTGFASAEAVQAREKWEEDNKLSRPFQWLSPEAIKLKHVVKSDIWSLAILIWEIFSPGQLPFGDICSKDAREKVLNGTNPLKPKLCSNDVYDILMRCWFSKPRKRPTLQELKIECDEMTLFQTEPEPESELDPEPLSLKENLETTLLPEEKETFICPFGVETDINIYKESNVVTELLLSSGDFYEVWKGKVSKDESSNLEVAIKKVKESNDIYTEYLHSQGLHLWTFREHNHIITCLGITSDNRLLVMEQASLGNLQQYLKDKENDSSLQHLAMDFIPQIIEGVGVVHHLHPPALFHCLCASNVLLSDGEQCKLTGFASAEAVQAREKWEEDNKVSLMP